MLDAIKRLFAARPETPQPPAWPEAEAWARRRSLAFRRARDGGGFVAEGRLDELPWRLEWGPPQRAYIAGRELRMRMELDLPGDLQMLLLSKPLMDQLERQTYESFTEGLQTQIDTATPEEMRWLVMFPKVNLNAHGALRERFGAASSLPSAVQAWVEGPLAQQLERALATLLRFDPPFVLMTLRGRAYLRMQLAEPEPAALEALVTLFEAAARQALRVSLSPDESPAALDCPDGDAPATVWQTFGAGKPR
ncbi:hypothetical protein [Piscinibacter sp.]|uniref:hypothetical protein n=1 Tax=Piscinibacter sp. TaxID=1903157 RepID=UPI0039E70F32